ncbi:hypothetical protein V5O48_000971 [Marasmius crinis-equi]|uniref:Exonuclease V n=1 Tax=Marasmius crinis-equi TaxID=585013 RepID=A0ABR3G045_9AGAR
MPTSSTVASDEYFDLDDFTEWTEEDFALLDAQLTFPEPQGQPKVDIELDFGSFGVPDMFKPSSSRLRPPVRARNGKVLKTDSPLQRFRRKRNLSVSDLVAPAWCEVQFDYGLRQGRHKELVHRPDSFVTKGGKEITVEKAIAVSNEVVLKKGKAVHKKLEKEIRPEEVSVSIETKEERWDMISCFQTLRNGNCAREMPVFGVVEGHVVIGIIDEVLRKRADSPLSPKPRKRPSRSNPSTPRKPKRSRTMPGLPTCESESSRAKPQLNSFLASNLDNSSSTISSEEKHWILHLNDTKTRRSNSLPSDDDTLSPRLQLMTYCRLLTELLDNYDFSALWTKVEADSSRRFSESFVRGAGLVIGDQPGGIDCLDDLTALWLASLLDLDVAHVDARLTLIYRSQETERKLRQKGKGKGKGKAKEKRRPWVAESISAQEQGDINRAIEASLRDLSTSNDAQFGAPLVPSGEHELEIGIATGGPDTETLLVQQQSRLDSGASASSEVFSAPKHSRESDEHTAVSQLHPLGIHERSSAPDISSHSDTSDTDDLDANIIGTKEFMYSASFLNKHLADVLDWWEGYREPRGVSLEHAWRCSKCEYNRGCEWRERKAKEFGTRGRRIQDVDTKVLSLGDQV